MNRISLPQHQHQPNTSIGQGRTGSHSTVASMGTRVESMGTGGVAAAAADGFAEGQPRLSNWMPDKLSSGCRQWLEDKDAPNSRASSISVGSGARAAGCDLPDYFAREVLKLTMRSASELEAVLSEVGAHDAEEAKARVVKEILSAIKGACDGCVRQEKEERDGIRAQIQQAKEDIIMLSRKLGIPTPADGEPTDSFFYCNQVMDTLFDRLVNLETTLDSLKTQQADRSRAVDSILKEMETTNENMDRQPEEGESEESGGAEWEGKEGWELSEERLEKLRGRLATLRVLKFERETEIVGLVVDCQKLFRELAPPVEHPLQTKMLMSLDPSSPADKPTLRTEAQTQTSVGLSIFSVDRLKKLREDMREDRELHADRKKDHRRQIDILWEKLNVPERHRQEHLSKTKGITHSDMDELEAELARLRKLKAEKLTDMLKAAREEIVNLLEIVGAKAEEVLGERARELHVPPDHWTESLLETHEEFVQRLHKMGDRAAPIVEKVKKREELVQKREYADSFNVDYRARGAAIHSQTMKVDGIKKEVNKKLPILTAALRKELGNWQNEEGFPFRYNGREYLKTIEESDMQWQHRKEANRRERNTPGGGSGGPSSPTRAAIHNGTFHSTGSMAFGGGGGVPASPSLHRQTSSRSGNSSLIGSPSPRTKGGGGLGASGSSGGSGWGSGNLSASGSLKAGIGRTGSASSNSSMLSAGGGPVVDSRGGGAAGQQHGGAGGGGEGARAAGAAGGAGAGAGGEGGRDPAAKSLPSTPQKNPLLKRSFTPSPTSKGSKQSPRIPSTFASTGGSHRLPPPPLPARPASVERSSPALAKLQSSPDLIRGIGAGGGGTGAGAGAAMPPPLPDRPSNAAFENADLQAIRESNASSLRSSASASDVLSSGRRTETTR